MNYGDHLVTSRLGYTHHGIYIGDNRVIHYSGLADGISSGDISTTSLTQFAKGNDISVKAHPNRKYGADESVERAYSRLGEDWYNVLVNNCEHFVTWCIDGFHSSSQVNQAILAISMASEVLSASKTASEIGTIYGVLGQSTSKEVAGQTIKMLVPTITNSSLVSSSAGLVSGLTTSSVVSTSAGTVAGLTTLTASTASIATGVASVAAGASLTAVAAPVVAAVAVAGAVSYGVKKIFDWFD
jgi:hypothetical protein